MADEANSLLIAGAGIAGMTTALALASRGVPCRIFEKRSKPAGTGAGIQLSPNAMHVLAQLGIAKKVLAKAARPSSIHIRDGLSGRHLARFDLGKPLERRYGAPYCVIHRADLEDILLDACQTDSGIALHYSAGIKAVDCSGEQTTLVTETGDRISGTGLIGADGVGSAVRKHFVPNLQPRFSGHVAWRAIVDLADVPPRIPHQDVGLWLLPSAHLVHYPVVGHDALNIVAIVASQDNSVPAKAWLEKANDAVRFESFASATPALKGVLESTRNWGGWPLFEAPAAQYAVDERVVLIGDAAHAMLPHAAQGGSCAIEDAAVLSAGIAQSGIEAAFAKMDNWRARRASRICDLARNNQRIYHANRALRVVRNLALRTAPQWLMQQRMSWVYGWKPPA